MKKIIVSEPSLAFPIIKSPVSVVIHRFAVHYFPIQKKVNGVIVFEMNRALYPNEKTSYSGESRQIHFN